MNALFGIDQQIFLLINHLPHWSILNIFFEILSGVGSAGIIWFILAAILFLKEEKKDHWFFLPVFLSGSVSYILVEKILKPIFARPRPSIDIGAIIVGSATAPNDFSFPSGHATIAWAMALVLAKKEPRWKWLFYGLAFLISFSRIFLGKHFPLDVITGGLLGWGIGYVSLMIGERIKNMHRRKLNS